MDKRLEDLEIRLSYQESTIEDLNQVVIRQQDQIDMLIEEIKQIKQQQQQGGDLVRPMSEETPPPHY